MKNLIYLLVLVVLAGCKSPCIFGQNPPIIIYCGSGCTAPLPDIKSRIPVSDNCEIDSYTQFPLPGYLLTPTQKSVTVILTAKDKSGNTRKGAVVVTMIDTIKPVFDFSKLVYQQEQVEEMYKIADRAASYLGMGMTETEIVLYPALVEFLNSATFDRLVIVKK